MELYDEVPYPLLTHSSTHPDRLAVVGRLMGLTPAMPGSCRVLDLGCGSGANVIAMAELLPGSRFLGIDVSQRQIADGRNIAAELGLSNVDLQAADILDLPDTLGEFDYVIAHGLFSWVPEPVRRKALRLIKGSLAPHGIAFVSFNAYPGWHQLSGLRDLMLYRTRGIDDPVERARTASNVIGLLAESQTEDSPFAAFVRQYHSSFQGRGPVPESQLVSTLLHDELSEVNQPFYFHEFMQAAGEAGLDFLAEADLEGSTPVGLGRETIDKLSSIARDRVEMEQYLDFIRNRGFRRTLLCHAEAPVARTLKAGRQALEGLHVGSFASPEPAEDEAGLVHFSTPDGVSYSTDRPLFQAAFRCLDSVHPAVLPFGALLDRCGEALGTTPTAADADSLAANLLRNFLHSRSLVEFYVEPAQVQTDVSDRPRTTAFARFIAAGGSQNVTNLRHEQVELNDLARHLVPLLDGEHAVETLAARASEATSQPITPDAVEKELRWLARVAMLVA